MDDNFKGIVHPKKKNHFSLFTHPQEFLFLGEPIPLNAKQRDQTVYLLWLLNVALSLFLIIVVFLSLEVNQKLLKFEDQN